MRPAIITINDLHLAPRNKRIERNMMHKIKAVPKSGSIIIKQNGTIKNTSGTRRFFRE